MAHTSEPWDYITCHPIDVQIMRSTRQGRRGAFLTDANQARIVACVNACAGIEDPAAELARLRAVADAARIVVAHCTCECGICDALDDLRSDLAALDGAS